jgi:hypothetical protein
MRAFLNLALLAASSLAVANASASILERAAKIQVDPTVVEHPEKVDDRMAANLVRYDLRAAVRDAHIEEGASAVRAHFVLDAFSSESRVRRAIDMGSGRSVCTVDGKLVFEDATGKELASVKIHVRGSVVAVQGEGNTLPGHEAASDLEQRLLKEIEGLK